MIQKHIILIDDDEDDRLLFGMAAARVSDKVVCTQYESATDALAALNQMDILPDVLFLDINLPGLDGFSMLEALKQHTILHTIPIMMYSTSGHQVNIDRARAAGASGYIKKPIEFDALCATISRVISEYKTIDFITAV